MQNSCRLFCNAHHHVNAVVGDSAGYSAVVCGRRLVQPFGAGAGFRCHNFLSEDMWVLAIMLHGSHTEALMGRAAV